MTHINGSGMLKSTHVHKTSKPIEDCDNTHPIFSSTDYARVPPEILGLNALSNKDLEVIQDLYIFFKGDLRDSLQFYNPELL